MKTEEASNWWSTFPMWGKVVIAWLGNIWGAVTPHLGSVVLIATLIYTIVNTWVLIRDKLLRRQYARSDARRSAEPEIGRAAEDGD